MPCAGAADCRIAIHGGVRIPITHGVGVKRFSVADNTRRKGAIRLALATCPYTLKGLSRKAGTQHMILAR